MKQHICLLFITLVYAVPISYITHYFLHERIKFVTLFTCWSNEDYRQISNALNSHFITRGIFRIKLDYNTRNTNKALQNFMKIRNRKHAILLDLDCENSLEVFNMSINEGRYSSNFDNKMKWVILSRDNISSFIENINGFEFRLDSDLTFAQYKNNTIKGYKLYHTGYNKNGGKLLYYKEHIFNVKTECYFNINNNTNYENRKDLKGVALRTITVITQNYTDSPESYLEERNVTGVDTLNKINFALFKNVIIMLNFRMVLNITPIWYGNLPTGIDGGITQQMWLGTVDVCATSALMFKEKLEVLDYITPTYHLGTCFLFRNPSAIGRIRNPFFEPFATSTWMVSVLFCIIICLCLKMSYNLHSKYILKKRLQQNDHGRWSSCLLNTVAAFCQQDIEIDVNYVTQRILVLTTLLLSLILYNYYTSSIVSDLISSQPEAFKSLHELLHSDMKLASEDSPYTRRFLKLSNDEDFIYMREKLQPPGKLEQYIKPSEGIKGVKYGGFAYHVESTTGYSLVAKYFEASEICDLKEIDFIRKSPVFLLIPKNSEYRKLISVSYAKMMERGILNREIIFWRFPKPKCLSNANVLQIELEQVAVAFLILLFGLVVSVLILILEMKHIQF